MFLRNHWVISLLVACGVIVIIYLLLYSTANAPIQLTQKTQASVPTKFVVKNDKYAEAKTFFKKTQKKMLEELYRLGDSASPSDLRRINFYERGGLIREMERNNHPEQPGEMVKNHFSNDGIRSTN